MCDLKKIFRSKFAQMLQNYKGVKIVAIFFCHNNVTERYDCIGILCSFSDLFNFFKYDQIKNLKIFSICHYFFLCKIIGGLLRVWRDYGQVGVCLSRLMP